MKKRLWKDRAKEAEARAYALDVQAGTLAGRLRELQREVDDKRENWTPKKITHPWTPANPQCIFCDEPRDSARHQEQS